MSRISDVVDRIVVWFVAILMAAETAVVFGAVVSRYVFNSSFTWSDEVARGILSWLIFLGAAAAYKRAELVEINLIKDALPEIGERIVRILGTVLILIFLAFIVYYGVELMSRTSRQVTFVLRLKLNYFSGAVVAGAAVMMIHGLNELANLLRGQPLRRKSFAEDTSLAELDINSAARG